MTPLRYGADSYQAIGSRPCEMPEDPDLVRDGSTRVKFPFPLERK
jgi:hypothetical protein